MQQLCSHSDLIKNDAKLAVQRRNERQHLSKQKKEPIIFAGRQHLSRQIEQSLHKEFSLRYDNNVRIVAVDDHLSEIENQLLIILESDGNDIPVSCEDVVRQYMKSKHQVDSVVVIVSKGTLNRYKQDDNVMRFALRDAYKQGKLDPDIIFVSQGYLNISVELDDDDDEDDLWVQYKVCFKDRKENQDPLDIETFEIVREWAIDVPIYMQIFLEQFINM